MNVFKLNGRDVIAKKFDFNLVCDLEDMGVSLQESGRKPMAMVRAYLALCLGCTLEIAGAEMEAHLANGGNFEDIMNAMSAEMENSDFFRNLNQPKTTPKKASKAQASKE